jgi:hypothetical protein
MSSDVTVSLPGRYTVDVQPASGGVPGPQGAPGVQGPQGWPGRGLEAILGTLGSVADLDTLPDPPEVGDAWLINGDLWIWKP